MLNVQFGMARFSYHIKIQLFRSFLRFDIRFLRSTFVFKVSHSFFFGRAFVQVQVWRSYYSIGHSFFKFDVRFTKLNIRFSTLTFVLFYWAFVFNSDVRFIQFNIHFFIGHLFFKFDIRFLSSNFVLSTLVLLCSNALWDSNVSRHCLPNMVKFIHSRYW